MIAKTEITARVEFSLFAVVFQDLQADFSEPLAMLLQAGKNAKCVRNRVTTESGRVRGAGSLLFRRALEGIERRRRVLGIVGRERDAAPNLKEDECSANFDVHCLIPSLIPDTRAWFDDNRANVPTFH